MSRLSSLLTALRAYADTQFSRTLSFKDKPGYHLDHSRWHAEHPDRKPGDNIGAIRDAYHQATGIQHPVTTIRRLDPEFSKKVGQAFEAMPHYDPASLPAYQALIDEVHEQAKHLSAAGHKFTLHYQGGEPYENSDAMRRDVHDNQHMHVYATVNAFGDEPFQHHYKLENGVNVPLVPEPNPLLQHVPELSTPEHPVLANDLFRWVHDAFGHGIEPHQFGPLGEDNAYREHMSMFSPLAQRALTTETRGQNSWVNFGPHIVREDGTVPKKGDPDYIPPADRPFADQKIALLPEFATRLDVGTPGEGQKKRSYASAEPDDDHDEGYRTHLGAGHQQALLKKPRRD